MNRESQLQRLGLFDARVPRYTSYPPANHFTSDVGPAQTAAWIGAIKPGSQISLYIHIPFCRRLCWFCACRTQGTSTASPVVEYVETLKKELRLLAETLPSGVEIEHLHWGGGTPTLLTPDLMADLTAAIFDVAPLASGAQFSVEIDPNEVDDARMDALAAAGMNRASIGVQDFDPEIQETIGRIQSYEVTKQAVDGLRKRGIKSLNMDLLYGLPHQDAKRIARSVQMLLSLAPDRVALYGYAHVPWMARRQGLIPTEALPTPPERLALFETARKLFTWDNYTEIGIDHFALPDDGLTRALNDGTLRRNFQGYTEDTSDVLIGVGASAISKFPQGFAQNHPSTSQYQKSIRAGELATAKGHALSDDDKWRGRMIEALMCDYRADFDTLAKETGQTRGSFEQVADQIAGKFGQMVAKSDTALVIVPEGRALTRMIAREIDAYHVSTTGHSHAI